MSDHWYIYPNGVQVVFYLVLDYFVFIHFAILQSLASCICAFVLIYNLLLLASSVAH